jgi:dinuclear metal center YbgI/SA1388 family protein
MTKLYSLIAHLESIAPPALQENYDNCGLITGTSDMEVKGVIISLDCTEQVIEDAIANDCNVIVSHHPIVFSGLKKLNGKNYIERTVIKAIKNDIAIYAIHTNLDNVRTGVNAMIAAKLGLLRTQVLAPKKGLLRKLVFFCPSSHATAVREAVFNAGAGNIGKYDQCSFRITGSGSFRPGPDAQPFKGEKGVLYDEVEERIEVIYEFWKEATILQAMRDKHPYEEIAYDLYQLENALQDVGSGLIGELENPMEELEFLHFLKTRMKTGTIRYTNLLGKKVKKIAICGGSGSFLLQDAKRVGADVLVTADFKYHQFFDAENQLVIADIGHYESEQFTGQLLCDRILEKFTTFAVRLTKVNTNPVHYL